MKLCSIIFSFVFGLSSIEACADPMHFSLGGDDPSCRNADYCKNWILGVGNITADSSLELIKLLEATPHPPKTVRLTSMGGDLVGAMALGQAIRSRQLNTETGFCLSACVYAFLGGVERSVITPSALIGLHRFYREAGVAQPTIRQFTGEDLDLVQKSISGLLLYVLSMGGDARVVTVAAEAGPEEMRWVAIEEAIDLRIVYQPKAWRPWQLVLAGDGVVALSTTEDGTMEMHAACGNSAPYIMLRDKRSGIEEWFEQCARGTRSGSHLILGELVKEESVKVIKFDSSGGAAILFILPTYSLRASHPAFFQSTEYYPMACIDHDGRYIGSEEKFSSAVKIAYRNCLD